MERSTDRNAGPSFRLDRGMQFNQDATAAIGAVNYYTSQEHPSEPSLQDLLKFPEMTYREHAIASVHGGTGRWLLNTNEYRDWEPGARTERNESQDDWKHRMLWIIGNAGAGKSALMKMAVRHAQSTYHDCLIFPHFFNARGAALEKSAEGMYRTLIYWLLEELPSTVVKRLRSTLRLPTPINWATPILAELLQTAISELPDKPVLFFVDALDECDEDEVYTMLSVFQGLVQKSYPQQVHVCFASRPHPHFGFDGATYLNLSIQGEHNRDIDTFVHEKLRIGTSPVAQEVKREVKRKAQGIFMWAVLVVQTLNSNFNHGNVSRLQQRLRDIPPGLHELFRYTIMDRYTANRDALLVCFQWLLFGDTAFTAEKLWWATQLSLGRDDQSICQDYKAMEANDMRMWIISISKGLVEFIFYEDTKEYIAQFVHESVRDFFFKEPDMLSLYGAQNAADFEGRSHEQLRGWCLAEINARHPEVLKLTHKCKPPKEMHLVDLGWDNYEQDTPFPFARYAYTRIMHHANCAQDGGRDQTSFLEDYAQQTGPDFIVITPGYSPEILFYRSLISVLLCYNCVAIIEETQAKPAQTARESRQAFGLIDGLFGMSGIYDAVQVGSEAAIDALIDIYMELNYDKRHFVLQSTLHQLAETWQEPLWGFESTIYAGNCLLDVASFYPALATFFLLVLAAPETLIPHLDELHHLTRPSNEPMLAFLKVLHLFTSCKLHSDAIDAADPSSIDWLVWLETAEAESLYTAEKGLWIKSHGPEEQQMILLLCRQIQESSRSLPSVQILLNQSIRESNFF